MRNFQHIRTDRPSVLPGFDSSTLQPDTDPAVWEHLQRRPRRRPAWLVPALATTVLLLTLAIGWLAGPWL